MRFAVRQEGRYYKDTYLCSDKSISRETESVKALQPTLSLSIHLPCVRRQGVHAQVQVKTKRVKTERAWSFITPHQVSLYTSSLQAMSRSSVGRALGTLGFGHRTGWRRIESRKGRVPGRGEIFCPLISSQWNRAVGSFQGWKRKGSWSRKELWAHSVEVEREVKSQRHTTLQRDADGKLL